MCIAEDKACASFNRIQDAAHYSVESNIELELF